MSAITREALVWVLASEVVRCSELAVENWRAKNTAAKEAAILKWQHKKTGFIRKRFYTREEAIELVAENPFQFNEPGWVKETILLGRAALLSQPLMQLQLSPLQISWLWPEIDPRKP